MAEQLNSLAAVSLCRLPKENISTKMKGYLLHIKQVIMEETRDAVSRVLLQWLTHFPILHPNFKVFLAVACSRDVSDSGF